MSGFAFRTGLTFDLEGVSHRIVRLGPDDQVLVERETDGLNTIFRRDDLLMQYLRGNIDAARKTKDGSRPPHFGRPLHELPNHVRIELQRRITYVHAVEDMGSFVYTQQCFEPVIRDVSARLADAKPPSAITLYRWLKRYRRDRQIRALIPRYDLRGSSTPRQTDRVLELVAEATEDAYKASPSPTGGIIYDRLKGKIKAENARQLPDDQLVAPSLRTLYRLLGRIEAYDLQVLRDGKAAADKRFRLVKAVKNVEDILVRVEADHTPLDLFLVDEVTALPLGRPILTVLIDVYSRFPLGYFLSFGGTSTAVVMGALRNAVLPKQRTKEVIPGLHVEHKWPCYGLMDVLVVDNGMEFHSDDLESVAYDLGIDLRFCPKRQPRFKGVIERFLKTVNYYFAHQLPGTSLAKMAQRGDYDPAKCAVLTMEEFKHLLEKWLLDVYAQTVHRGIGMTPWAKWHEGLARRTPELPQSFADLQKRIGLVRERRLRQDGIWLEGIQYSCRDLESVIRKWGIGVKVRVVFDPQDLGSIQIWPPDSHEAITVLAVDQSYANGLTLSQHEFIRQINRESGRSDEDSEALADAKYQMTLVIDDLLRSRKQRSRRRAAHMNGKTSDKPESRLAPSNNDFTTTPVKPRSKPKSGRREPIESSVPMPPLDMFTLQL